MTKKVEILGKRRVFDGFFKIDEADLRYERFDGSMSPAIQRLSFERGDSAAAILFDPAAGKVLLVNQFKYPTHDKGPGWIVEVVAGAVNPGESPEVTMDREIREETGYAPAKIEQVSKFYVTPGGSSERIFLFYAEVDCAHRLSPGGGLEAEHEDIEVLEFTPDELFEALDAGRIQDAKTIIAIMWLRRRLEGGA